MGWQGTCGCHNTSEMLGCHAYAITTNTRDRVHVHPRQPYLCSHPGIISSRGRRSGRLQRLLQLLCRGPLLRPGLLQLRVLMLQRLQLLQRGAVLHGQLAVLLLQRLQRRVQLRPGLLQRGVLAAQAREVRGLLVVRGLQLLQLLRGGGQPACTRAWWCTT